MGSEHKRIAKIELSKEDVQEAIGQLLFSRGIECDVKSLEVRMVSVPGDLFPVPDGVAVTAALRPVWDKIIGHLGEHNGQSAREIAAALHLPDKLVMRIIKMLLEDGKVKKQTRPAFKRVKGVVTETKAKESVYFLCTNGGGVGVDDILRIRWTV